MSNFSEHMRRLRHVYTMLENMENDPTVEPNRMVNSLLWDIHIVVDFLLKRTRIDAKVD